MAEKRMFSKQIIDSDAFLDMSLSTQALYFHLCMRADDDGFINNPKRIMRLIGCGDDELKLLIAKHFVIPFESGVCVIKHWKIHNYIQKDRYKPTSYQDEKSMLETKENKSYSLLDTQCIQDVSNSCTPCTPRLDKNRLDKSSIDKKHKYGEYKHVLLTDDEYTKLINELGNDIALKTITYLDEYIEMKGYKAKNHYLCIKKWVIDAVNKKNTGKSQVKGEKKSNFNNFEAREYNYKDLENKLLGWDKDE